MGEVTVTQQLRAAEASLAAARSGLEDAEQAFLAAKERREAAEAKSPILVAGGYGDASEWRAAHDQINFAHYQEAQFAEALETAKAGETEAVGRLRAAERRNLTASRTAALEKLGRTGADIVRQADRLWDLNRQISGRDGTRQTIDLVVKFIAVLGHQLKMGGLKAKGIHTDSRGHDWAGFVAWGESLLRGGVVPDGQVSERMAMAEALDQLPDPIEAEIKGAEVAEMIPAKKPAIGRTNGKTDYSDIGPEEPP
jgi:hypothetical protein